MRKPESSKLPWRIPLFIIDAQSGRKLLQLCPKCTYPMSKNGLQFYLKNTCKKRNDIYLHKKPHFSLK